VVGKPDWLAKRQTADPAYGLRQADLPLQGRSSPTTWPYHQWTRKIDGKTVTRRLTDEQAAVYGPCSPTPAGSENSSTNSKPYPCASSSEPRTKLLRQPRWVTPLNP
jgi:hypothetical protein